MDTNWTLLKVLRVKVTAAQASKQAVTARPIKQIEMAKSGHSFKVEQQGTEL